MHAIYFKKSNTETIDLFYEEVVVNRLGYNILCCFLKKLKK